MAQRNDRLQARMAVYLKPLVFAAMALSLSGCDRAPDMPGPPQSAPKPETAVKNLVSDGLKKALFSYSIRPNAPYQAEQPATAKHTVIVT